LACVCPRFVTPSRSGSEISDLHLSEAMSHSSLYCVKDHCCVTCRVSAYSTELPVDCLWQHVPVTVSPYLHIISIISTRTLTHESHCTFASGSSISPASAPWCIVRYLVHCTLPWCNIPCPQNYNTIISQNRIEHISFGLQNTVWAHPHPLSTAAISNNVIINPSTTGTFYPVFSSLFPYVILVTSETNCSLININIDLVIAVTGLFIAFPAVIRLLAFNSTSNTTCLNCFSIYIGFLTLAVSGCGLL